MSGKASKIKGSSGERELAKIFSGLFGGSFIRSPSSGAYVGGKNFVRKATLSEGQVRHAKGDLVPPDFMPKFVVESKNYDEFRFHQLLTPGSCLQLDEWIKQTLDCIDPGDIWFVCFKVSRIGWYVAVPDENQGYTFSNYCLYNGNHGRFQVTDLTDFFQKNRDLVLTLCK